MRDCNYELATLTWDWENCCWRDFVIYRRVVNSALSKEPMTMTRMSMAQEERENLQEGPRPDLLLHFKGVELVA
ncbi:hypothetical protein ACLOJK_005142 [Asimina triloba]